MNLLESIHELPNTEKLKVMEFLWEELTLDDKNYASPDWHQTELSKTERKVAEGTEQCLDWVEAKERLRNEFK